MKKLNLKNTTATLFFTLVTLGCSLVSTASIMDNTPEKTEVTLTSRYTGGDYLTASYSFRFSSQDIEVTQNNMEIIFEGREDFNDYFSVSMAADDNSLIYDLGEKSCKNIKSTNPELRKQNPLVWLANSEANPSKLVPAITALVKKGHCYLVVNNDETGRVITLFRVAKHNKSFSVKLNEVEVLENAVQK